MRPSSRSGEVDDLERGSAALEFILVGVVLLVPVLYLVVALGMIQAQSLGAEAAARHIARAISTADGATDAGARADAVLDAVVREYGMDAERVQVSIACAPAVVPCPAPGATVVVSLRTTVPLPFAPSVLGLDRVAAVPVEASAVQKVSRLWGAP